MDKKKFDQIDSLLFFAVFAVVCSHWQWSGRVWMELSPLGRRGVDLFFVISGFLITLGLIASKEKPQTRGQSLYKFYIRRFLRIFPIYYLTLFIVFIFWYQQMQGSLWWYILYMVNFYCIKMQSFGVAGLFWSLSVEEQFYLAWPLIILFTPNKRLPIVITLSILLSLIFKIYWAIMKVSWWTPYMHPMGSLDVLAMGGMLAYLYYFHFELLKKLVNNPLVMCFVIIQVTAIIFISYIPVCTNFYNVFIRTSFGLFSMWLIGRTTYGFTGWAGQILENRQIRYTGKISYAIYLFHDFVPGMLSGMKYPENLNLRCLIYAPVTVGLASLSWFFFESKILKLKDRFE